MTDENNLEDLPIALHPTALAMAALAVSFAKVLQDIAPRQDALALLQSKIAAELGLLRAMPGQHEAVEIFRFVRAKLHDPKIIDQPDD